MEIFYLSVIALNLCFVSGCRKTVETNPQASEHPAMRLKGLDDEDEDTPASQYPAQQQRGGRSAIDDEVNSNLGNGTNFVNFH